MDDVKQLLADIEADTRLHQGDIEALELLLKTARLHATRQECGEMWLATCNGDLAQAKRELAGLQKLMHEILLGWYVGSLLKSKEQESHQ